MVRRRAAQLRRDFGAHVAMFTKLATEAAFSKNAGEFTTQSSSPRVVPVRTKFAGAAPLCTSPDSVTEKMLVAGGDETFVFVETGIGRTDCATTLESE